MAKFTFFSIILSLSVFCNNVSAQHTAVTASKYTSNKYELTFSETDYIEVRQMSQFIENITVAKEVVFNDTLHKVSDHGVCHVLRGGSAVGLIGCKLL